MLAARVLAIIGSLGVTILTARMLGPEDRGRYYYFITLAAVGMQFASLGIHVSNTYLVARTPSLLPQILTNTAWIAVIGGVTAAAGAVVFDLVSSGSSLNVTFALMLIVLMPSTLLFLYLTNLVVALNRLSAYNGLIIFGSLASVALAAIVAFVSPNLGAFVLAAVGASVASSLLAWIVLAKGIRLPRLFDSALFRSGVGYALKAHTSILLGFLMSRMSIFILRQFGGFGDVGYWSIATQITDAMLILPSTVGLLLFPSLVRADRLDRDREFKTTLVQLGALMAVFCLVTALLIRPVLLLVFGVAYEPAVAIVYALLPGVFCLAVTSVASQFLSAEGYPLSQVLAWVVGAAIQAVLSIILFEKIGVVGLAWVQSGSAAGVCVWLLISSLKYVGRGR
jgi:O-antigen/teichoic acid export membrane protein